MPLSADDLIRRARQYAWAGRSARMLAACQTCVDAYGQQAGVLMALGQLFLEFGYLDNGRLCFERLIRRQPAHLGARLSLAGLALQSGDPAGAVKAYLALLSEYPEHPTIRRNALLALQYDPAAAEAWRLQQARDWGAWAMQRVGPPRLRPVRVPLAGRPLRVGYLSADFCQHTVGLFIKPVLEAHDPVAVEVFAYHAGEHEDEVTQAIRAVSVWRAVGGLEDAALAALIRQDAIDVLVDLSGHTRGSRLAVMAYRPAPIQVSWLGYFATTGLPVVDAVLLDEWHAPPGTEAAFVEPIVRLPRGRFCYQPIPDAPEVSPELPSRLTGRVTFASFNNTAKLNAAVIGVWARVLRSVPDARLVLKWRTWVDGPLCRRLQDAFAREGVAPERVELRPASFHQAMLGEYAEVDVALDPFPFTGGLTSCEALWMGVPVVTWPQSSVVSRQTFALLSVLDLSAWAASDADAYVATAVRLAREVAEREQLRATLRARMQASPLMQVPEFTRSLEATLRGLFAELPDEAGPFVPSR
jgi:protein O-GlcNAc transferase